MYYSISASINNNTSTSTYDSITLIHCTSTILQRSTTFKTDKNDEAFNLTSVFQRGLSVTELLSFDRNDENTDVLPFFSGRVFFATMDPIILSTAYSVLKQHYINLKVNRGHAGACTVPARKAANETRRVRHILKEQWWGKSHHLS